MDVVGLVSPGPLLHQESADATFRSGPDDGQSGNAPIRDPALAPVQDPVAAILAGAGLHAGGVGAEVWLRQSEAPDHLALGHRGQPSLLLLVGSVALDGKHAERSLDRDETAQPAVATLQLLAGEAVHHVVHARGTVA